MIAADQPTIFDARRLRTVLSAKEDGNMRPAFSSQAEADQAMSKLAASVGLSLDRVTILDVRAHQDVWDEIVEVTSPQGRVAADALVTNVPGVGLLLCVADCNAVAIHDPVHNAFALVHLGWQSTVADVAIKIIQHLQQKYHSSATDLRVYISPAIKAESYMFDTVSQADDPQWRDFLHRTEEGIGVDLPGFNRQRFIEAGVLPEYIELSSVNTATSDNYFSHYRAVRNDEPEGRFALLGTLT